MRKPLLNGYHNMVRPGLTPMERLERVMGRERKGVEIIPGKKQMKI